jgi:hypothetical protein
MKISRATSRRANQVFTLFIPGIELAPPGALPRLPALERLLARGRSQPLAASPWALLARLAGGDLQRWPVGPVSALGDRVGAPRTCLRVEPLGAQEAQGGAYRLPAAGLGIRRDEAVALAEAFHAALGADGWRLEIATPERWYLVAAEWLAGDAEWSGFDGPAHALGEDQRPAPPEPGLRLLLSEIEMLFHAHPVNAARRELGAAVIAALHPWGGGRLAAHGLLAAGDGDAPEEPYAAGLRRLGALGPSPGPRAEPGRLDSAGVAWPAAVETLELARLAAIEHDWAAPLLAALRRGRLDGVRTVTGRQVHETRRADALRFWRRPRPVAELC